jgi:hypothetical protein
MFSAIAFLTKKKVRRALWPSASYAGINRIRFEGTRGFHDLSPSGRPWDRADGDRLLREVNKEAA